MSLAAAYSGLAIEYIDGVTEVDDKTLPPGGVDKGLNKGSIYAWRAHMNVLRRYVHLRERKTSGMKSYGLSWTIGILYRFSLHSTDCGQDC